MKAVDQSMREKVGEYQRNSNQCILYRPYLSLTFELGLVDKLGFADGLLLG